MHSPHESLLSASQLICENLGIELIKPNQPVEQESAEEYLARLASVSHFRYRKVSLTGNWWEYDNGPLLVFDKAGKAYGLIINKKGYYCVDEKRRESLKTDAYSFYRTFPMTVLNWRSLLSFGLWGQGHTIARLLILQAVISLVGLAVPIAMGMILDTAIPNADLGLLAQFILGLTAMAFAVGAFGLTQALTGLNIRFKMGPATQMAVLDRLLRLPASFFRQFSPGDLAMRARGIDAIRQEITGTALGAILGGVFSVLTLGLLFYYSAVLALGAVVYVLIIVGLMLISNMIQLKFQRPIAALQGKLAALSLQFINSVSKLRASGSEERAFSVWSKVFSEKVQLSYKATLSKIRFGISRTLISVLAMIWIFSMASVLGDELSLGHFVAFNAAFGQFFAATLSLAAIISNFIVLIPLYERIQPILTTLPEREKEGISPGVLQGKIVLKEVGFRYQSENPMILEDFSLEINPGEFIALVGATGSGKSTLLRLLLGFETPTHGNIYYDEYECAKLNLPALRQQMGVVLQNATLMPGTVFENIIGNRNLTLDAAWEAAHQVGLAAEIEAMPMGMQTMLTEGGRTLSMGQRQRLMIARALIHKPRILILDEAMNALDNLLQAEILQRLAKLNMTRILITHRSNALVHVDRVCVLAEGKVRGVA